MGQGSRAIKKPTTRFLSCHISSNKTQGTRIDAVIYAKIYRYVKCGYVVLGNSDIFGSENSQTKRKPARSLRGPNGFGGGKKILYFLTLVKSKRFLKRDVPLKPYPVVGIIHHGRKIFQSQIGIIHSELVVVTGKKPVHAHRVFLSSVSIQVIRSTE